MSKIIETGIFTKLILFTLIQPKFVEYVNRQLQMGRRARFPLCRTVMKTRVIPSKEVSANVVDLFNGK